jgi:hypothetical protein
MLENEAIAAADRVLGETGPTRHLRLAGRLAGRLLGALLLVTGVFKAVAPQAFGQQIAAYEIVTNPVLIGLLAYAIIIAECGLGAALLVNYRPRLMLGLAGALLVVFLIAVGTAWATGSAEDCGCFPWMTRTPGEAFVEDLVLLAVVGWAWWGHRNSLSRPTTLKLALVAAALVAGVTLPAVMGLATLGGQGAKGAVGSEAFRGLEVKDPAMDLSSGEHLVLLMSTECSHCKEAVPRVNALFEDKRLPPLVAIASEDYVERGLFRQDYGAQFPIGQISEAARTSLLEKAFPRLFLVRDGQILAVWDGEVPGAEDVLARKAEDSKQGSGVRGQSAVGGRRLAGFQPLRG